MEIQTKGLHLAGNRKSVFNARKIEIRRPNRRLEFSGSMQSERRFGAVSILRPAILESFAFHSILYQKSKALCVRS